MTNKNVALHQLRNLLLIFIIGIFCNTELMGQNQEQNSMFEKVVGELNFPEGPAWDGNGNLYVSSCYGGYIAKISGDTSSVFIKASENPFTLKQTNGLTFDKFGNLYACEFGEGAILKITPEGKSEIYASGYKGKKFNRPNDLAFDLDGNLYFTDPKSYDPKIPDGVVYRIDKETKEVTPAAEGICFCNGIAFSSDGKEAYVCESAKHRILKYNVEPDGMFSNKSVFVDLPGGDPDGIAFDSEGFLYAANFGSGKIYIINPDGSVKSYLTAPGKKPSNVEFAGNDLKTLYITEDETNTVYKTHVDIPGMPLLWSPVRNNK